MAFLDENGLEHFWNIISDKFSITKLWENAKPESVPAIVYNIPNAADQDFLIILLNDATNGYSTVFCNIRTDNITINTNESLCSQSNDATGLHIIIATRMINISKSSNNMMSLAVRNEILFKSDGSITHMDVNQNQDALIPLAVYGLKSISHK